MAKFASTGAFNSTKTKQKPNEKFLQTFLRCFFCNRNGQKAKKEYYYANALEKRKKHRM
jgi:hypothetical protein